MAENWCNKCLYLMMVCCILFSGSAILITTTVSLQLKIATLLVFIVLSVLKCGFIIRIPSIIRNSIGIKVTVIILISLLSSMFNFNGAGLHMEMQFILSILLAIIVVQFDDSKVVLSTYVKVIRDISVFSLSCYLLFSLIKLPNAWMLTINKVNDNSVSYKSIVLFNQLIGQEARNCGPFWEPGIFAAYVAIAILVEQFYIFDLDEERKRKDLILFSLTIITTFSTGGYLLLVYLIGMKLLNNVKTSFLLVFAVAFGVVLSPLILNPIEQFLLSVNPGVFSKIFSFQSMGTTMTRYYSVLINCYIWMRNKIWGVGLDMVDREYVIWRSFIAPITLAPAQTSTSTLYLAAFGLGGFYINYLWLRICIKSWLNPIQKGLLLVFVFFILNEVPHTYFVLTYIILFSFLKEGEMLQYEINEV